MTAIAEQPTANGNRPGTFTSESARIASARAHEARRINRTLGKPSNQPQVAESPPQPPDPYTLERLAVVRAQIKRLDSLIDTEVDPNKLDRLASAQSKFAEQERQYANRSLPPSLRAPTVKARQPRSGSNSMPEPIPIGE